MFDDELSDILSSRPSLRDTAHKLACSSPITSAILLSRSKRYCQRALLARRGQKLERTGLVTSRRPVRLQHYPIQALQFLEKLGPENP